MSGPILVTGGTGTLGTLLVPRLRDAGHDVRVLSRHEHPAADGVEYVVGDLAADVGIQAAVAGVTTIVHCAGSAKGDEAKARTLAREAARAGAAHLVYISVVGADRVPTESRMDRAMYGYYQAKLAGERIVADSGVPFSTLRATQFHDLVLTTARQLAKLPVLPVPAGFLVQPVDADDVAARLAELTLAAPAGLVPDLGGPRTYLLVDLVRDYLRAAHRRRPVVPVPMRGAAARAFRAGANLTPEHADGRRTWEDFLAERVGG